jgi:membrane protease YdiL (CAAX protease family)
LSVFAHLGRPLEEIAAAIPAGLLFGAVDLRLGSLWWVAALHWIEGAALNYFILRSGG